MKQKESYSNYRFKIIDYRRPTVVDWSSGCPYHFLNLVLEGHGTLVSESGQIELKTGDFYYIPMGLSYKSHWDSTYTKIRSMAFRIFPDFEKFHYSPQQLPKEFIPESRTIPVQLQPDVFTLGRFYTLLAKLTPLMQCGETDHAYVLVAQAKKWMSNGFMRVAVSGIADKCQVSESTLYAAFQKVEGKTPNAVRKEIVIAEAVRVLTETKTSITRLSEHLGFSSDVYFRKVIKDATGTSPSQIRKQAYKEKTIL